MSKVEKTTDTKALAVKTMDFLPSAEVQEQEVELPKSGSYLPYLEMVFPIMQPGQPIYKGKEWTIGFKNGNEFQVLEQGTILTVIDSRNVIKQTTGPKTDRKNEYAYQEITRNGKAFNQSKARYDELLLQCTDDADTNLGTSMVCGIIFPDGKVAIADFSAFKTMNGYITPALFPAKLQKQTGIRMDIENHEENLVKSKFGNMYPKNLRQYEHIILEKEQVKAILEALNSVQDSYLNWLNQ